MKTALIIGSTGLVGNFVLQKLLLDSNYSKITTLVRKSLNLEHEKLNEVITDFNQLDKYKEQIKADVVFCCLGTTIKTAGSKAAFKKVDYEYPVEIAKHAKNNGCQQYLIVTAMDANKNSSIFYNKVKGEAEDALKALNFETLHILQPSLLLGNRNEKRFGERIAQIIMPIFNGLMLCGLKKYRAIEAKQVAKAMVILSNTPKQGVHTYTSNVLQEM
ncbi:MAG: oxidoreductase [Chitinophagales bacterium]